jgi:hypothetical protein
MLAPETRNPMEIGRLCHIEFSLWLECENLFAALCVLAEEARATLPQADT